ncbi:ArnT family glycosyltransferase [Geomonas azotofigens]|uniref:ArnT family glycosyltransferase n=1 Tax=Geomonas azotofigens TaxID=2843196 RepID=UPI001C10F18C|nr:glycosyltransferase family 39 protein [Geomonas azotofigens]MBU5611607.1 glycosyltransferase family 39 protein [Geomonas azotofigens]
MPQAIRLLIKELRLPVAILVIPGIVLALLLPYFPVDETRYLGVAWEMWNNHSFIVPLQNGLPYSHKPPLLFWLLNLDWALFGINEGTLRFIPLIFSLCNLVLVYRIALKLWDDRQVARYAAVILASMLSYLLWSSVIMFDVILAFWVLLAVLAVISAAREHRLAWYLQLGVAIGGGILTKGPVVLVYVLPVALLGFLWIPRERFSGKWYAWLGLSILIGIGVVLFWLVPAALTGGETYRRAILWGQTVHRMTNSFAHKRPIWWYLPWIPTLLMPWALFPPAWRAWKRLSADPGFKTVLIWGAGSVVIFSLLSGKQVHYLVPVLPTFSLLMARSVADERGEVSRFRLPIAGLYLFLGAGLITASLIKHGKLLKHFDLMEIRIAAAGLIVLGAVLFLLRPRTMPALVNQVATASLACCLLVLVGGNSMFQRYELHPMAQAVRQKQAEGYQVLHAGKYHGQFHFLGRLSQPLVELPSRDEIRAYAATHDKIALITYVKDTQRIDPKDYYFLQPFRSRQAVMWTRDGIATFLGEASDKKEPAETPDTE